MNTREEQGTTAIAAAAAILRRGATLTDPARRADAVWEGLGRLGRSRAAVRRVVDEIEQKGGGGGVVPDRAVLLSCARGLERMEATRVGIEAKAGTDPGRFRSPALRADSPTTKRHRRLKSRRRRLRI